MRPAPATPSRLRDFLHDLLVLERAWATIAAAAADARVAVGLGTERIVDDAWRLTALVINPDGTTAGFQHKVQLDPSEESLYSPGSQRHMFQVGALKFGIVICHEGWRYPETVRWVARAGDPMATDRRRSPIRSKFRGSGTAKEMFCGPPIAALHSSGVESTEQARNERSTTSSNSDMSLIMKDQIAKPNIATSKMPAPTAAAMARSDVPFFGGLG